MAGFPPRDGFGSRRATICRVLQTLHVGEVVPMLALCEGLAMGYGDRADVWLPSVHKLFDKMGRPCVGGIDGFARGRDVATGKETVILREKA